MTQSGLKTEFLAFSLPPTQSSIESTREVEYSPLAALNNSTSSQLIEFNIPGSSEEFIDLDSVFIKVTFNYTGTKEGAKATDPAVAIVEKDIAPVNNLLHSFFEKVELTIQSTTVNPNSNLYAYRAYIENLLGYSNEAKTTFLRPAGWLIDKTKDHKELSEERSKAYPPNKDHTLYGMLHLDLGGQDKLILNGTSIRLALQTAPLDFYLQGKATLKTVKVEFKDVKLFVTKKRATTAQMQLTERSLSSMPACYPIRRIEMKEHLISKGSSTVSLDNIFNGSLPSRIIMGLVDNSAVRGIMTSNPFYFGHKKLTHACCYVNGESVPRVPYKPSFHSDPQSYEREYVSLFNGIGKMNPHPFCDLTMEEFAKGHTLLCFNLSADGSDSSSGHFNPVRRGTIRLDLAFAEALTATVSVILFAEFDSVVTIDKHRNVQIAF